MYILKLLIVLLLIAFPFGELLRFDLGNNIRFKPLDVITIAITVWWFVLFVSNKIKRNIRSPYFFVFPLICLLSLLANLSWLMPNEVLAASLYLIRWIAYAGVFFVVLQIEQSFKNKIVGLLLADGIVILLLGFVQYFFFSDLKPLYYLGWDDHMYRMFSVFLDPNFTGAFFALFLFFCMGLFYKYWQSNRKTASNLTFFNRFSLSKKQVLILLGAISILTLIALFLTFSRSSLLMLIAGASVFFILIGRKKFIFLLFAAILVFTLLISSKFYVENMNLFRQASSTARLFNYQSALEIVNDHPIIGVGFNTYRYAKESYSMQTGWVDAPSHADAGVDNSFLFVLVTTGIMGLISYILLWGILLKRAFFYYKKQSIFAIIFIASSAGLFIHAMFVNSLFFPAVMVWMWVLAGLMERKSH